MARQTPKAKARRRRAAQVATSNTRKAQRGAAIQSLNNLVAHLDLGCERLNVKAWSKAAFAKVLRVLARRCTADADAAALRQALTAYTLNGGALPEGMVLTEVALELPDDTSPVPYVPRHRVLATTFQLKSCAFMVRRHKCPAPFPRLPFGGRQKEKGKQTNVPGEAAQIRQVGSGCSLKSAGVRYPPHGGPPSWEGSRIPALAAQVE